MTSTFKAMVEPWVMLSFARMRANPKRRFPLADLALDGIALSLVISKLLLLLGHQLSVILGASEARTTQANTMTLAEGPI